MYKWTAFPFIRISFFLALGIILSHELSTIEIHYPSILTVVSLICLLFYRTQLFFLRGLVFLVLFILIGGWGAKICTETNHPNHYVHSETPDAFVGKVISDYSERTRYLRYEVQVSALVNDSVFHEAFGKIHLFVLKDSLIPPMAFGDRIAVNAPIYRLNPPKNPNTFDYGAFLKKSQLYAQSFTKVKNVKLLESAGSGGFLERAYQFRRFLRILLRESISNPREHAIASALLLGVKDHLDEEVREMYVNAGAMHVLAVSGLHVGILYLVILTFFRPWKKKVIGQVLFVIVSIGVIWMYALITGFSPSVMRASTMFTVIILGGAFKRKSNVFNSLGIAAFILILFDPLVIYSVGFQLSFAAVFGIVLIYPPIYRQLTFQNGLLDYLWSITCVSIAAQIATFPLTFYYFHQLPTYALLANFIVIPAATAIMVLGLLLIVLGSFWTSLGMGVGWLLELLIFWVNESIGWIRHLPYPTVERLYFDQFEVIVVYLFLLCLILSFRKYDFQLMLLAGVCAISFCAYAHLKTYTQWNLNRLVVYSLDQPAIDLIEGPNATLYAEGLINENVMNYIIEPNRLALGLPHAEDDVHRNKEFTPIHPETNVKGVSWKGLRIMLVNQNLDSKLSAKDSLWADIVYFRNSESLAFPVTGKLAILGDEVRNFNNGGKVESLKFRFDQIHDLARDGSYELDL